MAPEIPTVESHINYKIVWTTIGAIAIVAAILVGVVALANSAHNSHVRQNKKDIADCIARGGQVITESENWFVKCVGGNPIP